MGSFGAGAIAGSEYGIWIGLGTFVCLMALGIYLHKIADKIRRTK